MNNIVIFPMGDSPAIPFAAAELKRQGVKIAAQLDEYVTHVLLNVPGGVESPERIPSSATVIGGNLDGLVGHNKIDLLQQAQYVAENAALTADCALRLLGQRLPVSFQNCPILVIGWGRIGKCLAKLLQGVGAKVTVAARKPSDRGMLTALGYEAVDIPEIKPHGFRAILNTVPAPVLPAFEGDCLKIDLASRLGMAGENVIWARGLPGKMLPESAGQLIAQGVLRQIKEEDV